MPILLAKYQSIRQRFVAYLGIPRKLSKDTSGPLGSLEKGESVTTVGRAEMLYRDIITTVEFAWLADFYNRPDTFVRASTTAVWYVQPIFISRYTISIVVIVSSSGNAKLYTSILHLDHNISSTSILISTTFIPLLLPAAFSL